MSDDDRGLHHEIPPQQRLDAILESELPLADAVAAMNALFRENQSTFPHIVISTVMVEESYRSEALVEHRVHIGPFPDRGAAEGWARRTWAENARVQWSVAKCETPAQYENSAARLRAITDGADDAVGS